MNLPRTNSLWRSRQLIWELTSRELKQRYRGTFLGGFWSILNPLIMLAIYTFVFSFVFQARWPTLKTASSNWEFAFILFAGLIPFNLFSEICNRAPALIINSPSYVKKVIFPLEVLPLATLLVAIITSLINTSVLLVGSAIFLENDFTHPLSASAGLSCLDPAQLDAGVARFRH